SAIFADKSVGSSKVVTVMGISITGADSGNYVLSSTTTSTASITPLALLITASGVNKTYDGTAAATVTLSGGVLAGDDLSLTFASASFADKNAGASKAI